MTSRLKHKLELENVNLKSAYLNESFVQIGTPLPDLASNKRDKLEYVPEWQQEVRDEQGRRRFHGAFTGGFSAGYFNTVGSKEGWAPSEFKSSRSNRANRVQRPEDFMDEEDLQQMNDDRQLENTEAFQTRSSNEPLQSLIGPAETSIGQSLLKKLGWKPGQGIGPRISLRKLRKEEGRPIEMGEDTRHTFAPRDVKLAVYRAKDDREGLGYVKGNGRLKETVQGQDDDVYAAGPSTSRAFAFDYGEEETFVMGDRAQPVSSGVDTWHDGRPVLTGFTLDPLGVPPDKWFALPDIPPDWRPRPARVWGTTRKWDNEEVKKSEVVRGSATAPLSFADRGAALGEQPAVSKAKSVFEYMNEKDRERLAVFASQAIAKTAGNLIENESISIKEEAGEASTSSLIDIPPLSPRTASAALRGFIPYGDDPHRQDRYRSYLSSQTYNTSTPNPVLRTGTIEEINKELADFAASARIFKPMSFAMSNRFTSGSTSLAATDLKQPKPGLHVYDAEKAKADMEKRQEIQIEVVRHQNPREEAAANGMYGKLTREVKLFYPEKLLCRRFGVQNPHPEGDPATARRQPTPPPIENDASWEDAFVPPPDLPAKVSDSIEHVGLGDDSRQGRDTLTYTKPSIDIFKAIFDDSDDEGDDDRPEEEEEAGPVDMATFKPVFKRKEALAKEKSKKKKRKGVLSFNVEDDAVDERA